MNIDSSRSSPAQTPGRQGWRVDRIVWHHTGGGSVAGALNWVTRPGADAGYHYLVDEGGRIFQTTLEQNTSWHAGDWNMNLRSIGICHPVDGGGPATRDASVQLTQDICRRYGIPADAAHILPHRAIVATICPGNLPMADWISMVAGGSVPGTPEEEEMLVLFAVSGGTYLSDGIHYRWVVNEWDLNAIHHAFPSVRNVGEINGFAGMGVPADQGTASLSGQEWPPAGPAV